MTWGRAWGLVSLGWVGIWCLGSWGDVALIGFIRGQWVQVLSVFLPGKSCSFFLGVA
jgi:hypothetical protein